MKIQCSVCSAAEARVLCCADEAALCLACDENVHAANKLAGKHHRLSLSQSSSSSMPKCDICQEAVGYFFCLQDRALFCQKCDIAIHTKNSFVSAHQRFLFTGIRVGLEHTDPGASSSSGKSNFNEKEKVSKMKSLPLPQKSTPMYMAGQYNKNFSLQNDEIGNFTSPKMQLGGGSEGGGMPQCQVDEYYGPNEFTPNCGFIDQNSSKADGGKLGDSDSSSLLKMGEEELDGDEFPTQLLAASWMVPEIPSPPTASGIYSPKNYDNNIPDKGVFVPDICSSQMSNSAHYRPSGNSSKRRREF